MIKHKQKIHGLRNEKLQKIRYELRTILRLERDARVEKINKEYLRFGDHDTKLANCLIREKRFLDEILLKYPINCIICGDRMRNLTFYPQYGWLCSLCELDYK